MFRPQPMINIDLLLLQRDLPRVVRALASARILHLHRTDLRDFPRARSGEGDGDLLGRYRNFLRLTNRLMEEFGMEPGRGTILDPGGFPGWESWAEGLRRKVEGLRRRKDELARLNEYLGFILLFLRRIREMEGDLKELRKLRVSSFSLGLLGFESLGNLPLSSATVVHPLARTEKGFLVAILSAGEERKLLERRLSDLHFTPIPLPSGFSGSFPSALERIRTLRLKVRRRLKYLERRKGVLREENDGLLRDRSKTIEGEVRLLEKKNEFGFTDRTVVIGGWIPRRRLSEMQELLDHLCRGRYLLRQSSARGGETPVLLFNPALVRPFQKILSAYGTPSYGEIEPTPLLAVGFLILFGMMFGDLGQGLVLVGAGLLIRRFTRYGDEGTIVAEVGAFAALFGILFGSFFGMERLFPPLWFSPMEDIPRLMAAALLLGAILISTGMLLRIVNGLREDRIAEVLTDRYGLAGLLFYFGSLSGGVLAYRHLLPPSALLWLALPLGAIFFHPLITRRDKGWSMVGESLAEGAIEVLETILGFLANTFSFLRVAAFGLAHVGLFMAVFALAETVRNAPLGLLWAVLIHIAGNLIILVLEGLIVSVQTVRLEFYEIFSKFFRGGGVAYRPLAFETGSERRH